MVAMLFAAMHPDRVSALVLHSAWARATEGFVGSAEEVEVARARRSEQIRSQWGDLEHPWGLRWLAPSRLADPEYPRILARVQQVNGSRAAIAQTMDVSDSDVSAALPLIQAPTLVACQSECAVRLGGLTHSRACAVPRRAHPERTLVADPRSRHVLRCGLRSSDRTQVEEFLTGTRAMPVTDRVLATVLFTDIVELDRATRRARRPGVARPPRPSRRHGARPARTVPRPRGQDHR